MNFYFIGLIFRGIRNVCLFPGRLLQDSSNKARAGRFPEEGEREVHPACLELLRFLLREIRREADFSLGGS
jgi:hypothetical protein